jgi:Ca2+-binding EF-hand superfamily protein
VRYDLDGNGVIEMKDIVIFVSHWDGPYDAIYDFNKNGRIDFPDLISLVYKIRQVSR